MSTPYLSGPQVAEWEQEMKRVGLARSSAACARLLGLAPNTLSKMKKNGTDQRTALALRALLHRHVPWSPK